MCPDVLKKQVAALKTAGVDIEVIESNNQCYVVVRGVPAPSPPWDKTVYDIVIAIPAAFDDAGLDGFYLGLPYKHNEGQHQRVNGGKVSLLNREWQLVSWHYPDGKPWQSGRDSLETHIVHCRGFFLHRGAINDYR
jgi:hypothetical protein